MSTEDPDPAVEDVIPGETQEERERRVREAEERRGETPR
jgi:hypothetical protein